MLFNPRCHRTVLIVLPFHHPDSRCLVGQGFFRATRNTFFLQCEHTPSLGSEGDGVGGSRSLWEHVAIWGLYW